MVKRQGNQHDWTDQTGPIRQEFKIIMINKLKAQVENVGNMYEQMENFNKGLDILRTNQLKF